MRTVHIRTSAPVRRLARHLLFLSALLLTVLPGGIRAEDDTAGDNGTPYDRILSPLGFGQGLVPRMGVYVSLFTGGGYFATETPSVMQDGTTQAGTGYWEFVMIGFHAGPFYADTAPLNFGDSSLSGSAGAGAKLDLFIDNPMIAVQPFTGYRLHWLRRYHGNGTDKPESRCIRECTQTGSSLDIGVRVLLPELPDTWVGKALKRIYIEGSYSRGLDNIRSGASGRLGLWIYL